MGDFYDELLNDFQAWVKRHQSPVEAITIRSDAGSVDFFNRRAEWSNALLNALIDIAQYRGLMTHPTESTSPATRGVKATTLDLINREGKPI